MTQQVQKEMVRGMTYILDAIDTRNVANPDTSAQQMNPNHAAIRPATIKDYSRLRLTLAASKSGSSDSATTSIYFGPLGTNADPLIAVITALSGSSRSQGVDLVFKRLSATQLQRQGSSNMNQSYVSVSPIAYSAAVTVSNMDVNTMYVSIYNTMTSGTEVFAIEDYFLELIPSDSTS